MQIFVETQTWRSGLLQHVVALRSDGHGDLSFHMLFWYLVDARIYLGVTLSNASSSKPDTLSRQETVGKIGIPLTPNLTINCKRERVLFQIVYRQKETKSESIVIWGQKIKTKLNANHSRRNLRHAHATDCFLQSTFASSSLPRGFWFDWKNCLLVTSEPISLLEWVKIEIRRDLFHIYDLTSFKRSETSQTKLKSCMHDLLWLVESSRHAREVELIFASQI